MVVRIRLQRFGNRNNPFYRIVSANQKAPRDGKFLEILGTYNPIPNVHGHKEIRLKTDRLKYWIGVGAQPSERVGWILGKFGILPPLPTRWSGFHGLSKKERKEMKEKQEQSE